MSLRNIKRRTDQLTQQKWWPHFIRNDGAYITWAVRRKK